MDDQNHFSSGRAAKERQDRVGSVIGHCPLETGRVAVELVESRLVPVDAVQVAEEFGYTSMPVGVQQRPLELALMGPFRTLGELSTHEQQFLTRLGVHRGEESPKVGVLLPVIARHLL